MTKIKYIINKIDTFFCKSSRENKKSLPMRGFTLGVAMIIMGVLITITLGMSALLLRDIKTASVTEKSSTAYNLADGMMNCILSYDNQIRYYDASNNDVAGLFPTSTTSTYNSNYKTSDGLHYLQDSIKCFEKSILTNTFVPNTYSVEPANIQNAPPQYDGGVRTNISIKSDFMSNNLYNSCVKAEIYAKDNQEKLFITRASVPCTGDKTIERVIVRSVQ